MKNSKLTQFLLLSFAIGIVLSFSSCEKVKDLAKFDITYSNPDIRFTLDSIDYLPKSERLLLEQTLSINIDSIVEKHDLDGIENAKFDEVSIEIESPAQANFNWLTSARATVSAEGINETEVAATTSIAADGRSIDLNLSNTEVISQISTGNFTLRLYGNVTPPLPAGTLMLLVKSKIKMTVKPL